MGMSRKKVEAIMGRRMSPNNARRAEACSPDPSQRLELPWPPSVNAMYATVRGNRVLSREGRDFKDAVAAIARAVSIQQYIGDVTVNVYLYRPRKSGDVDNFLKATLDSLTGIAYADDGQIRRIVAERFDGFKPGVIVTIMPYEE